MSSIDIPEVLRNVASKASGLPPAGLTILPRNPLEIQSNRLYDIHADHRHLIAKEYILPNELQEAPVREFKALQLLSSLDIAPQPVFFEPSIAPIVVYEYMEGEMWDRRKPEGKDLANLAKSWLKIHSVPSDWLSRGSERSLDEIEAGLRERIAEYTGWVTKEFEPGRRAAAICQELLDSRHKLVQELACLNSTLYFCRSDPRFANVIQRPDGRIGFVDWEDSGLRDPARELADILMHPNQEDLESWAEWKEFLEPYIAVQGKVDDSLVERMRIYLAIFPIFWLTNLMSRGIRLASVGKLDGWKVNGVPGNVRMRRFLARALAWPDMNYADQLDTLGEVKFFGC